MTEWKLVPVEPTPKMHKAAWGACENDMKPGRDWAAFNTKIYGAMLAAAPAAPDAWQPIETAPKGGPLLVCFDRPDVINDLWPEPPGRYVTIAYWDRFHGESGHWCECHDGQPVKPTHWRPLPAPPLRPDGQTGEK
jgi:hypothetical protein